MTGYAASGDLDTTFSGDGIAIADPPGAGPSEAMGIAIQSDGKILSVTRTETSTNNWDIVVARQNPNGSLDTTFDGDGFAVTGLVGHLDERASDIVVQPDGRIVVVGYMARGVNTDTGIDFVVLRYNPNGSLDSTFGTGGVVSTDIGGKKDDYAMDVAIQSDGKIVVAGFTNVASSGNNWEFAVARYQTNGALDTGFSGDGKQTTGFSTSFDYAYAVAIQSNDKILVGGMKGTGANNDFALARYNNNGSLDTTFDGDGRAVVSFGTKIDVIYGLAIQADGKIVATGAVNDNNFGDSDIGLARFTTGGKLDATFDGDGRVITTVGNSEWANAVVIQADGKIVVAGGAVMPGTDQDFALVRYHTNGSLDTSFGGDGKVTTAIGAETTPERSNDLKLDGNGKIVAGGGATWDIAVMRYLP